MKVQHDLKTRIEESVRKWQTAKLAYKNRSSTMLRLYSEAVSDSIKEGRFDEALDFLQSEMVDSPEKVLLLAEVTKLKLFMNGEA